jgi:hypothetical protein
MSDPIPLSAPDGTVYAYACGRCRCLASPPEAEAFAPVGRIVELSLARATKCCVCPCGAPVSETSCWGLCEPCDVRREAEIAARQEAERAALAARGVRTCPECYGRTLLLEDCDACGGTGEVPL